LFLDFPLTINDLILLFIRLQRFNFDKDLYLDRYLISNRTESEKRRVQLTELRRRKRELEEQLRKYADYKGMGVGVDKALGTSAAFLDECHGAKLDETCVLACIL
jgi:hypothetical protein